MEGLPDGPARLDFATGEVWSRACHGFAAGMRAQRLPSPFAIGAAARLAIPPDPALAVSRSHRSGFRAGMTPGMA